jgi:site-specific DNA recombinase
VGSIVNSQFIKNLRISVQRALNGRVRDGLIPGRLTYGYSRGSKACEREIDPDEAKIVLRIFEEYASGKPAHDIAADLMREKVVAPGGGIEWSGGAIGAMLHNQIYIGKLVWNAASSIKNPDTGRRIFRRTRAEDVITVDVPHMRIFPQDLWDRVHAVLAERRDAKGRHGPRVYKYANKDQLLVGLLTCGVCGGTMVIGQNNADGSPRVVCSYGHRRINCMHHRSYCLKTLEADVLDGVKHKLSYPRALLELTREYHARWAERQKQTKASRGDRVTIQIDRYVAAIGASDQMQVLVDKLKQLEIDRVSLTERLKLIDREDNVVTLHPKAIDEFSKTMQEVHEALTSGDLDATQRAHFRAVFRNVFERFVVHPTGKRQRYKVEPYLRIAAILGVNLPETRSPSQMLAEQDVSANRLSENSRT